MLKVENVGTNQQALVAQEDIKEGTELLSITGKILRQPTVYTIQTDINEHSQIDDDLKFTQHFCRSPNARFDFNAKPWVLKAQRAINKGDLVTYDYVTTEFKMADHFQCSCRGDACRNEIKGFYYLSDDEKRKLISDGLISPVVVQLHFQEK